MKIALCFRFAQTFCLHFVQERAIFKNFGEKSKAKKEFKQGYTDTPINSV